MSTLKRLVAFAALMLFYLACACSAQAAGSIIGFGRQIVGVNLQQDFIKIAAGHNHGLGLKRDGSVVAWGDNTYSECEVPAPNSNFSAISAGVYHSLGLKVDGSIVAWGFNAYGQSTVPVPNSGFVAVSAGIKHSLGLKADGSIVAWGNNTYGQCNVPTPNSGFIAIAAGDYHNLGLRADGSIVAWGYNSGGQCTVPAPNSGFTAIAAGGGHSLGLKADGTIVSWGFLHDGVYSVPAPSSGFVAIAAGEYHSLGLTADGSIVILGGDLSSIPAPNSGFMAIAAGQEYSLGLKTDGSIVAWGSNKYGQCNIPAPNRDFTAIATSSHSLGLKTDGSIATWGLNIDGQCNVPAPNSGFTAIAAGFQHSLGLRADGSIAAWGDNRNGQCIVPVTNSDFMAIAAGHEFSLGLKEDGSIIAWGYNLFDVCNVPAPNSGFVKIAAGSYFSLGLKADGSIVAWGDNAYGQCDMPVPNSGFTAIAAGFGHSLGLKADGSIVGWGDNTYGQCDVPAPNSGFVAIAAGSKLSIGLKTDGSIVTWGYNDYGHNDIPAPNSGFTAIATDGSNILAIRSLPLTTVNLTGNPASPTATGMPVILTATPTGGEAVEYQFMVKAPGAITSTILRAYGTGNTCPWTPTQTGTYALCVYAREEGSTAQLQVYKWISFTVKSPLTAVNLTGTPASPTATGTPVTLTATPTGGGTVEYQFLVKAPGATTSTVLRAYGTAPTCAWTPTQTGTYALCVYAREVGSTATLQAYKWIYYTVKTPLTAVNLAGNPASPTAIGMPVILTATPTGGGTVEYQFLVKAPGATTSTILRGYSTTPTCTWTPSQVGSYALCVYAREKGSTATLQAYKWIYYTVNTPLTAVSLAGNPASPAATGMPVTLTATPTGGGTVEYQFLLKAPGATTSTMLRAYGTTRTCLWTPTVTGSYALCVYAREKGSTATLQAYKWIYYTVNTPPVRLDSATVVNGQLQLKGYFRSGTPGVYTNSSDTPSVVNGPYTLIGTPTIDTITCALPPVTDKPGAVYVNVNGIKSNSLPYLEGCWIAHQTHGDGSGSLGLLITQTTATMFSANSGQLTGQINGTHVNWSQALDDVQLVFDLTANSEQLNGTASFNGNSIPVSFTRTSAAPSSPYTGKPVVQSSRIFWDTTLAEYCVSVVWDRPITGWDLDIYQLDNNQVLQNLQAWSYVDKPNISYNPTTCTYTMPLLSTMPLAVGSCTLSLDSGVVDWHDLFGVPAWTTTADAYTTTLQVPPH